MNKLTFMPIALSTSLFLGACSVSDSSDTGERLEQRGEDISGYGQDWEAGQKDYNQGKAVVEQSSKKFAEGEQDLARAQQDVAHAQEKMRAARSESADGQKLVSAGSAKMQRAEASYASIRQGPPVTATPPE